MRTNLLEEMLLIQEPSVINLYKEMMTIAEYLVAPIFTIALLIEYFGDYNFGSVVKKLLIIVVFMGAFYEFHTRAVEVSLEAASYTLKKVSPRNVFAKKWFEVKVRTKENKNWNSLQSFVIPNLNDLLGTAFFLLSKVFIWLLKLIYSTAYHLNYVFSGFTAVLYFLGWTKDAIKGTIQTSIWCMLMPFVVVSILALVGNSFDESALNGEVVGAGVDNIIWLFGVTLLLLASPVITFGMVKGEGVQAAGSKMGTMLISSGIKAAAAVPVVSGMSQYMGSRSTSAMRSLFRGGRNTNGTNSGNFKDSKFASAKTTGENKSSELKPSPSVKEHNSNKPHVSRGSSETIKATSQQGASKYKQSTLNRFLSSIPPSSSDPKSHGKPQNTNFRKTPNEIGGSKNSSVPSSRSTKSIISVSDRNTAQNSPGFRQGTKNTYRPARRKPNELRRI